MSLKAYGLNFKLYSNIIDNSTRFWATQVPIRMMFNTKAGANIVVKKDEYLVIDEKTGFHFVPKTKLFERVYHLNNKSNQTPGELVADLD